MGLDDTVVLWQMGVGAEDWSDNQLKMALGKDGLEYASFLVFYTRTYIYTHIPVFFSKPVVNKG
jgi:hypothetical protein